MPTAPAYIYLGQYHGKSLVSRLIRWMTWSDISHTAAFCPDLNNVIEAWQGGVRRVPWTQGHTPGTEIDSYRVACTPEQAAMFFSFLEAQLGKPYDYAGILGFVIRRKSQDQRKWFCSELVFAAARHAGLSLLDRIEPHQVDPGVLNVSPLLEYIAKLRTL